MRGVLTKIMGRIIRALTQLASVRVCEFASLNLERTTKRKMQVLTHSLSITDETVFWLQTCPG